MDANTGARERLESRREALIALSHRIHAHPEIGFEEERAAGWLSEDLADLGFQLSFAATLGLALLAPPLLSGLPRLPLRLDALLGTSVAAQAAWGCRLMSETNACSRTGPEVRAAASSACAIARASTVWS